MSEWRVARLSEVCEIVGRGITPQYNNDGPVTVVNQKCIREGRLDLAAARRHGGRTVKAPKLIQKGDVLVNSTGVGTLGRTAAVQALEGPTTVDTHVTIARPSTGNPGWVRYLFRLLEPSIEALAEGSTGQTELSRNRLAELEVLVPSPSEQRAIAGVLGALDDKIESNRHLVATCELLSRVLLEAELGDSSEVVPLGELVRFRNSERRPLSALQRAEMSGERVYPYFGATGVFDYVDDYLFNDVTVLVGEDGSVVNGDGSPVVQLAWGRYWVNNHAHVLVGEGIANELLYVALKRSDVRPLVTGAVQAKISMGNLRTLGLELPAVATRGALENELRLIIGRMRQAVDETAVLQETRDALLPELLSGRLRVRDAEKVVEEAV